MILYILEAPILIPINQVICTTAPVNNTRGVSCEDTALTFSVLLQINTNWVRNTTIVGEI